jgi:hypothetical protein
MKPVCMSWMTIASLLALAAPIWAAAGALDLPSGARAEAETTKTISISPSFLYTGVNHVANGVALRNSCSGTIALRGIPAGSTLKSAYLYWNYMNDLATGATSDTEEFNGVKVTGTKVADQPDLCWGTSGDHSYRAEVTPVASGGNYTFTALNCSDKSGQNPWVPVETGAAIEPAWEGATLVETYSNSNTTSDKVAIFDNLKGASNSNAAIQNFAVEMDTGTTKFTGDGLFTQINADGQVGFSFSIYCAEDELCTDEEDYFNDTELTGPGAIYPQSDWDGSNGWPLPQLWDTHTLDVEFNGTSTNTDTTYVTDDCIAPVAYVEQQGGLASEVP